MVEEGRIVVNRRMAKRGGEGGGGAFGHGCAVSWQELWSGFRKKTEMGAETEEREKEGKKNKVSIHKEM